MNQLRGTAESTNSVIHDTRMVRNEMYVYIFFIKKNWFNSRN